MSTDDKIQVDAATVRQWARNQGIDVGNRGHLADDVVQRFNRRHRAREYRNTNPLLGSNRT